MRDVLLCLAQDIAWFKRTNTMKAPCDSHCDTLILSPHIDDEVLGCFSFLISGTFVLFGGVESRPGNPSSERIEELNASKQALGFDVEILDNTVNAYVANELIAVFESTIQRLRPCTVLFPVPSYNQDHRAFNDAALVATRPHDTLHRVNRVLSFEQPHSQLWPYSTLPPPAYHRPISIDEKLTAYARYESQVRGHRSPATVAALAAMRGAEIGVPHAEAFHVHRWVDAVQAGINTHAHSLPKKDT